MRHGRTRVKFCGFTRAADLQLAIQLGVDAIGLIAVAGSKRQVGLEQAVALRRGVPSFVATVLLVLDPDPALLREWLACLRPDLIQFHGSESPEFCERFDWPYVKALPGGAGHDLLSSAAGHARARGIVLDAHAPGGLGGTGNCFDWAAIPPPLRSACILSGGLRAETVARAILEVGPYAVDVASGIEAAPGIKDPLRMQQFMAAVRAQDASLAGVES